MSFIKKHKVIFIILLFLILIGLTLFLSIKIFQYNHPTHYKFNDRFIIGNTIENIEAEYGPCLLYTSPNRREHKAPPETL